MHASAQHALQAYARITVDNGVATASPHRLILMLFEGARLAIASANHHLHAHDIAAKGAAISKAISIIDNGLKASLDVKAGGELAERLSGLYQYVSHQLLLANLHNDEAALMEAGRLLTELHDAWAAIAPPQADITGGRHAR